jgi:(p)ppGpp synthase/HD superfamily hydrolase
MTTERQRVEHIIPDEVYVFTKLLNFVRGWLRSRSYYVALKALEFARERHCRKRKDGITPEFSHQLHIARFFINLAALLKNPERVITLVFLHDVYEDGLATLAEIEMHFGPDIAQAVKRLSKIVDGQKLPNDIYYAAMLEDVDVCLVKGGDRGHNIETMEGAFTTTKKREYALETRTDTLPMLKKAKHKFPEHADILDTVYHLLVIYVKLVEAGLPK